MKINRNYLVTDTYAKYLGDLMDIKMSINDAKKLIEFNKKLAEIKGEIVGARDKQLKAHKGKLHENKLVFEDFKSEIDFKKKWEEYINEEHELKNMQLITITPDSKEKITAKMLLVFEDIIQVQS